MRKIAEVFISERVITHVLHERATVGKRVCFSKIFWGRVWETADQKRLNVVFPKQIDHLFMSEDRISCTCGAQTEKQRKADQRVQHHVRSFHNCVPDPLKQEVESQSPR